MMAFTMFTYIVLLFLVPHAMLILFIPTVFVVRGNYCVRMEESNANANANANANEKMPKTSRHVDSPLALPSWISFPLELRLPFPSYLL